MSGGSSRDRDIGRKWESGALKRKRNAVTVMSNQALSLSMMKFLKKSSAGVTVSRSPEETSVSEVSSNENLAESSLPGTSGESAMIQVSEPNKELESETMCDSKNQVQEVHLKESFIDLDPGKWVLPLNNAQRHDLIQNGLNQNLGISDESSPKDANNRHFSKFHFTRKLSNGETQHRRWLVYSIFQDKVYCFPCRLFSHLQTQVVMEGCCDWKDLSRILQRHEQSQGHMECMIKWMELYKGIKHGKTIDKDNERSIKDSQRYWFNLFERMIDIINYLAVHNLSFRGHRGIS
ncbi:zinc finger MYM-type protein 5-like [Ctenocephalides felis]|uniref:zinc finger MYM-type protein 5-like n=1 Tax=Ctenocephalides felis TaxID=7515 RepID=UPI000E6E4805|nr:zinc finger MYM-type protein 5-like [Ctenocephalides felis]